MAEKIFLNDVGHLLTISTQLDLTGVNTATLEIRKPENVGSATWIASIFNTSTGTLVYVVQSGDMNTVGVYESNAFIWTSVANKFHGDTFNFEVFDKWQ